MRNVSKFVSIKQACKQRLPLLGDVSLLCAAILVVPAAFIAVVVATAEPAEKDAVRQYLDMYYPEFKCEEVAWSEPIDVAYGKLVRLRFRQETAPGQFEERNHLFSITDGIASLLDDEGERGWRGT